MTLLHHIPRQRAAPLTALRTVVLLAGKVRSTPLRACAGRAELELPVRRDRTLLDLWCDRAAELADALGTGDLSVRVLVDRGVGERMRYACETPASIQLRVEGDPGEFRGTAGVLRDVAADYDPDEWLLVATASRLPIGPLPPVVDALAAGARDVVLLANRDGTLADMMLIRCGTLAEVPPVGFIDLKEQALPWIGTRFAVDVRTWHGRATLPLRSLPQYLEALRALARLGTKTVDDPFAERWSAPFAIVENGADVAPTAALRDAVVLKGGRVGPGALVARSLVGPGGTVAREERALDRLIGSQR